LAIAADWAARSLARPAPARPGQLDEGVVLVAADPGDHAQAAEQLLRVPRVHEVGVDGELPAAQAGAVERRDVALEASADLGGARLGLGQPCRLVLRLPGGLVSGALRHLVGLQRRGGRSGRGLLLGQLGAQLGRLLGRLELELSSVG
jgi:hypothetical protein